LEEEWWWGVELLWVEEWWWGVELLWVEGLLLGEVWWWAGVAALRSCPTRTNFGRRV
jgi:hypothetical protein